jgi:alpha-beta hydrolase superfamily lysophospholipase
VRAAAQNAPSRSSPVLLVIAAGAVSQTAIARTAELAAGAPVTVVGVAASPPPENTEQLRRAVALAMSVLENTGVMALGHIAVTGSPARAIARVARARGARVVVLDHQGQASGGLAAELRRRVYGSGIVVVCAP